MRNILVVDDDALIGNMLVEYFSQHDFTVSLAESGAELGRHLTAGVPDLLIVDMNLGDENGVEVIRGVSGQIDVPIIMMSGDSSKELDSSIRLELGARDYVAKPFSLKDMLARVRAALEGKFPKHPLLTKVYMFDDWQLNMRYRRLSNPSYGNVELTADEVNLLVAFLETAGQVLSREQLLLALRLHSQETVESIDTVILRLRRKLEQGGDRQYITTHRGAGYSFAGLVQTTPRLQ